MLLGERVSLGVSSAKRILVVIAVLAVVAGIAESAATASQEQSVFGDRVVVLKVKGTIDGSMEDYVKSGISYAESRHAIVVLEIDTPGGWVVNALEIVGAIEDAKTPVIGYVSGKWAMSAGSLILMCSHIAAMKPGAIIGAAQPVVFNPTGGGYTPVNESKIVNPIVGKIRACTELRLRSLGETGNISSAVREAVSMVTENKVFEASEAKKAGIIEVVASSLEELLSKLNGTRVDRPGFTYTIIVSKHPAIEEYRMSIGLRVAHLLSDPVMSSLLSTIGILVILAALFTGHPYAIVVGVALLLLSLLGMGYSASLLGIVLIVAGLVLLIVELTLIPGFGVVGSTGIALLVLGLIMLPAGAEPVTITPEYMQRVLIVVLAVGAPLAGFLGLIVYKALTAWRKKPVYTPSVVGREGRAIDDIPEGGEGFIIVEGEYWRAKALKQVKKDCKVKIVGKEGPIVVVEPVEECS